MTSKRGSWRDARPYGDGLGIKTTSIGLGSLVKVLTTVLLAVSMTDTVLVLGCDT